MMRTSNKMVATKVNETGYRTRAYGSWTLQAFQSRKAQLVDKALLLVLFQILYLLSVVVVDGGWSERD